jgi:hypothetical protein
MLAQATQGPIAKGQWLDNNGKDGEIALPSRKRDLERIETYGTEKSTDIR